MGAVGKDETLVCGIVGDDIRWDEQPEWCPLKPMTHDTIKDIDVQMYLEELKNESNISN